MDDCIFIEKKLNMHMVKTLFLCDRRQQNFYLFITCGHKVFHTREFSHALGISRMSFAPLPLMESMLGTKVGAATVFSALMDTENRVQIVFDKDILSETWCGCSDGTTTGYLKIQTAQLLKNFLPHTEHEAAVVEI